METSQQQDQEQREGTQQQTTRASSFRFLDLTINVCDQIYKELLCAKNTVTKTIGEEWHYQPTTDLGDTFDFKEAFPEWVLTTKFNFNLAILRTNRQIYHEAIPFFGWKNNWVRVTSDGQFFAEQLLTLGCAMEVPTYPFQTSGDTDCWAMEISVTETNPEELMGMELVMTVDELDDLVLLICCSIAEPLNVIVRIRKPDIFPHSYAVNIEKDFRNKFKHIRIGPYARISFLVIGTDRMTIEKKDCLQTVDDSVTLTKFTRKEIIPFNTDRRLIDWKAEEIEMIKWNLRFCEMCRSTLYPSASSDLGAVWKETLVFANLKMAIAYVAQDDLEMAAKQRACLRLNIGIMDWQSV